MLTKDKIIELVRNKNKITTRDLAQMFGVSRQYASRTLSHLVMSGKLIKIGSTRSSFYILPEKLHDYANIGSGKIKKKIKNKNIEEHEVLKDIEERLPRILELPENIRSIFNYAFSEMLNNAIEHSLSERIDIDVSVEDNRLFFSIRDFGIGVFRNVMKKRKLKSETEAIQDILKGKTTTMLRSHSGEGIFFTSKVGDLFILDSFGYRLMVNNNIGDVFIQESRSIKGTLVEFSINLKSSRHLSDVFAKYTDVSGGGYGFDKTEIQVKLYTIGGVYVSRSQARRVLAGLDKFRTIIFDFDKVPMVGQAFADEVFRVFQNSYPDIKLKIINANKSVQFMIDRAKKTER